LKYKFKSTPEMVVAETMLDAPLELPNIPATILAGMYTVSMALAVGPLSGIHIPGVEPVHTVTVPEP
jgi:hypothetical protein